MSISGRPGATSPEVHAQIDAEGRSESRRGPQWDVVEARRPARQDHEPVRMRVDERAQPEWLTERRAQASIDEGQACRGGTVDVLTLQAHLARIHEQAG